MKRERKKRAIRTSSQTMPCKAQTYIKQQKQLSTSARTSEHYHLRNDLSSRFREDGVVLNGEFLLPILTYNSLVWPSSRNFDK